MNTAEFMAALPEPHVILGLRLLPLSLGRYRLLKRFNCPFVADEEKQLGLSEITRELLLALVVCGLPCKEFKAHIENNTLEQELSGWSALLLDQINSEPGFNILQKAKLFEKYLADGQAVPWKILEKHGNAECSQTHWSTAVEMVLRSRCNWDKAEIDEEPLTEALAIYFKYLEGEGQVKLVPPEVYEAMQAEGRANWEALQKMMESQ